MKIPHNKTKEENIKRLYSSIMKRVGAKGTSYENRKMLISKDDFISFISKDTQYNRIYKMWVECDFDTILSPTIDRIDNNGHYSLDNIQVLTLSANSKKGRKTPEELELKDMKPHLRDKRDELIFEMKEAGHSNAYIGAIFNIDRSTVSKIKKPSEKRYFKKLKKLLAD